MHKLLILILVCSFTGRIFTDEISPFVMGHLMCQLGNQMFQIAAATSLALDHNATPLFPDLKANNDNLSLNYKHVFSHFNCADPTKPIEFAYKESEFDFHPIPYHQNMSIYGYFQSEKYFKHHKQEILDLFAPSEEILNYLHKRYPIVLSHPNTVSIHIRMYKDTTSLYHPFVGWNYILKAMKHFETNSLFVVFSDQTTFCKKKLRKLLGNYNIVLIEGNQHFQDLYLMSLCKHNIIANSSFSWWGAYLNKNSNKIVIAPSPAHWFGPGLSNHNTKDIIPEGWLVVY